MGLYPRPETRGIGFAAVPKGILGREFRKSGRAKRSIRRLVVSLPGKKAVSQIVDDKPAATSFPAAEALFIPLRQ